MDRPSTRQTPCRQVPAPRQEETGRRPRSQERRDESQLGGPALAGGPYVAFFAIYGFRSPPQTTKSEEEIHLILVLMSPTFHSSERRRDPAGSTPEERDNLAHGVSRGLATFAPMGPRLTTETRSRVVKSAGAPRGAPTGRPPRSELHQVLQGRAADSPRRVRATEFPTVFTAIICARVPRRGTLPLPRHDGSHGGGAHARRGHDVRLFHAHPLRDDAPPSCGDRRRAHGAQLPYDDALLRVWT